MNMLPTHKHLVVFNERGFWHKLSRYALNAGKDVVEKALWLYYASQRPDTPAWAKATIYGALTYFILPSDAVPDLIPLSGYSDDIGVLALAVVTIAAYIDSEVKDRTAEILRRWFG